MHNKGIKRICSFMLAVALVATLWVPMCFADSFDDSVAGGVSIKDSVRVGWFNLAGSQYTVEGNMRAGYYYDIYKAISTYFDFEYEYVYGSWNDCLEKLKTNESDGIDILANVEYTEERAKFYDFSSVPVGKVFTMVVARAEDSRQYASLGNIAEKTVAAVKGSYAAGELKRLCAQYEINCDIIEYPANSDCFAALRSKAVDVALASSMQQIDDDIKCAFSFSPVNVYMAVTKGNSSLLKLVNYALEDIVMINPDYFSGLYNKYFSGNSDSCFRLLDSEKKSIAELDKLRVYLDEDEGSLADTMTGELYGIIKDYLTEACKRTGVTAEFYDSDYGTAADLVSQGKIDVIPDFYFDYDHASKNSMGITSPYLEMQTYSATRDGIDKITSDSIVAAVSGSVLSEFYVLQNYDTSKVVWCNDEKDCLKAVRSGKADVTYINAFIAKAYHDSYSCIGLELEHSDFNYYLCFAFADGENRALISAFSRALMCIEHDAQTGILMNNAIDASARNEMVHAIIIFCFVAVFVIAFGAIIALIIVRKNVPAKVPATAAAEQVATEQQAVSEAPIEKVAAPIVQIPKEKPVEIVASTPTVGLKDIDVNIENLKGKHVLLAEDNELNAMIAVSLLEKGNMIVSLASNGEQALEIFEKSEIDYFDVILMDVNMPVMGGLDATRAIRLLERDDALEIPIIALTASSFCTDIQECLDAGMDAHLSKPIEPQRLFMALTENVG